MQKIIAEEEDKRQYYCSCCGKPYPKQKGNFSATYSPLYAGNNGYVTICNSCRDKNFIIFTDFFSGNEEKAIDRICSIFDWYYHDMAVSATRKIDADRSRVSTYPSKMALSQTKDKGTTYLDTIRDRESKTIDTFEKLEELKEQSEGGFVSERTVKRWGLGYSEEEYQMLNDHYRMLKDKAGDDDVKDTLIKDLCEQFILKYRARQSNDIDKFEKLSKLYQNTLANADLKPKDNKPTTLNNPDECWGNFVAIVEKYSPAEFFKDKDIFKDFNGIDEYCNRHIRRSTENLINGTNIRDDEFNVENGDQNDT